MSLPSAKTLAALAGNSQHTERITKQHGRSRTRNAVYVASVKDMSSSHIDATLPSGRNMGSPRSDLHLQLRPNDHHSSGCELLA